MEQVKTENEAESQRTTGADAFQLQRLIERARDEQNLLFGVLAGAGTASAAAVLWAVVTVVTGYQIGWMAIGVGFVVGLAVRTAGRGVDVSFGVVGAALALFGCLAGNMLGVCILLSQQESIELTQLLTHLNPTVAFTLMRATFSPIDLLFYGLAIYQGYRFSILQIRTEDANA